MKQFYHFPRINCYPPSTRKFPDIIETTTTTRRYEDANIVF
jgi:hypothetical protein